MAPHGHQIDLLLEQEQVRSRMVSLSRSPNLPNVLLLEGGNASQRLSLALYWAACVNCQEPSAPCLQCRTCEQVFLLVHQDVILLDGAQESIKIDPVRELRSLMGQAPKGEGVRVIILAEGQEMSTEAANCLLKSMEEPAPRNVFVLSAPQREALLPTLVSRSWVLTLGWPGPDVSPEGIDAAEALLRFAESGRGWFQHTSSKGAVDDVLVGKVIGALQKRWVDTLSGRTTSASGQGRAEILRGLHLLDKVQEGLTRGVNPALLLDWLAVGLWESRRN
jgi:DNA polymerase III subunit delta'